MESQEKGRKMCLFGWKKIESCMKWITPWVIYTHLKCVPQVVFDVVIEMKKKAIGFVEVTVMKKS